MKLVNLFAESVGLFSFQGTHVRRLVIWLGSVGHLDGQLHGAWGEEGKNSGLFVGHLPMCS